MVAIIFYQVPGREWVIGQRRIFAHELAQDSRIVVVYDGDCPLCNSYVRMTRLREAVGRPTLVNARERPELVKALAESGINLDEGMAVYYRGRLYVGSEAVNLLALAHHARPISPIGLLRWCWAGPHAVPLASRRRDPTKLMPQGAASRLSFGIYLPAGGNASGSIHHAGFGSCSGLREDQVAPPGVSSGAAVQPIVIDFFATVLFPILRVAPLQHKRLPPAPRLLDDLGGIIIR